MTTTVTKDMKAYIGSSNFGPVLLGETVLAGADLTKGTILGRETTTGKMKAYASGSTDGSQNPVAVLMEDAAAASVDVAATCGFGGVYVEDNMTGLDAAAKTALEGRGIYFN